MVFLAQLLESKFVESDPWSSHEAITQSRSYEKTLALVRGDFSWKELGSICQIPKLESQSARKKCAREPSLDMEMGNQILNSVYALKHMALIQLFVLQSKPQGLTACTTR